MRSKSIKPWDSAFTSLRRIYYELLFKYYYVLINNKPILLLFYRMTHLSMYVLTYCYAGTYTHVLYTHTHTTQAYNSFEPIWGRRLAQSFCHVILYVTQHKTPRHCVSLLELQFLLRVMTAAFTLSRSVKDGTQTQEINLQWQRAIHHFHHFSCENKKKRLCILSTLINKLTLTSYVISARSWLIILWSPWNIFTGTNPQDANFRTVIITHYS